MIQELFSSSKIYFMFKNQRIIVSKSQNTFIKNENEWKDMRKSFLSEANDASSIKSQVAFKDFIEVLVGSNLHSWASCGTLLGLIRDGHLISWDDDADVDYLVGEKCKLFSVIVKLSALDFIVIVRPGRLFTSINAFRDGFKCSLGGVRSFGPYFFSRTTKYPKMFIGNEIRMKFFKQLNTFVPIPELSVKYLHYTYGDWQTPNNSKSQFDFTRKRSLNGKLVLFALTLIDNFGNKRIASQYMQEIQEFVNSQRY